MKAPLVERLFKSYSLCFSRTVYIGCPHSICMENSFKYSGVGLINIYVLFIYLFIRFLGLNLQHMEVPRLGVKSELQLLAYTTADGNACCLTNGARPGIETSSSWILVRFVSTEPHWELLQSDIIKTRFLTYCVVNANTIQNLLTVCGSQMHNSMSGLPGTEL